MVASLGINCNFIEKIDIEKNYSIIPYRAINDD